MQKFRIPIFLSIATLYACSGNTSHYSGTPSAAETEGPDRDTEVGADQESPQGALTCAPGKVYKGFGDAELAAGRVTEIPSEGNRFRIKPYAALLGEFKRVLATTPKSLTENADSFAEPPERWFLEPHASAITLFTIYRASYEAALTFVARDPKTYAAAPDEQSAALACTGFAKQAWNRLPSSEEMESCKNMALVETAEVRDVKARWAYVFASIMSATGFISY